MITLRDIEHAASQLHLQLTSIQFDDQGQVSKVVGRIPVTRKEGGRNRKSSRPVRWEPDGKCYAYYTRSRLNYYDIRPAD